MPETSRFIRAASSGIPGKGCKSYSASNGTGNRCQHAGLEASGAICIGFNAPKREARSFAEMEEAMEWLESKKYLFN
ncbi:MAG: hypothetical protein JKX73_04605 [Flavobacteriales bacterium]|nr:hypothetical protein [Flavobacteriales bacterium]